MFKTAIKAFLAFSLLFGSAQANDTSFGGVGSNLLPIKNNNISMVDEQIILEGIPIPPHQQLKGWKVTCTFHFKNETSKPQKVTMGFPFPREIDLSPEFEESDLKTLDPETRKMLRQPAIRSFKTTVRGAQIASKEIKIKDKESPYGQAWIWDVSFAPGETVEVINIYEHDTSSTSDGSMWVNYVLKTGKNWKGGRIGRSQLEVRPKIRFQSIASEEGSSMEVKPSGYRMEADGEFQKIVWDLKDFKPDSDLYFPYRQAYHDMLNDIYTLESGTMEKKDATCEELRLLRNAYYAAYDYPFQSADLKEYFGKKWWYRANPKVDLSKLPAEEQQWLNDQVKPVQAREKELGCRK